jgi:DNA-binding SARP family transcriptional activator
VEFRLLGPLEVVDDGRALPLGGRKQRSVLAMLLLNANSVVSTDRLIDAVWGARAPATIDSVLHGYVSKLRRLLGSALQTRPPGYALHIDPDCVDAARFERTVLRAHELRPAERARALREALALWRGPALADLAYEDFTQPEIARLEELRLAALEERIDADLTLGRHANVVGELEALVREHPLRERFHAQLMLALYRAGRQVEALDAYRAARRTLVDEAGVEPGPDLRELERRVLAQDPTLAAPEAPGRQPVPGERPARRRRHVAAFALLAAVAAGLAGFAVALRRHDAIEVRPRNVAVVDPAAGRVVAALPVGSQLGPGQFRSAVTVAAGALWVANAGSRTVTRIDLVSREARTFGVDLEPFGLAVAGGSLWVTGRAGGLVRAPLRDPALAETVALPQPDLTSAEEVAASGMSVWVVAARGERVVLERLDSRTGAVGAETPLGPRSATHDIVATPDSVWVTNTLLNVVWRVSRATDRLVARIPIAAPTAIAAGSHAVWVTSQADNAVWKIDAATNLGSEMPAGDAPIDVAVGGGAVWVANWRAGTVTRINPGRGVAAATIRVAPRVSAVAWARGLLWVVSPERKG